MAILAGAFENPTTLEQPSAAYQTDRSTQKKAQGTALHERKLTLAELWEIGRKMGLASRSESTQIIRKMRDERYGG